MRTKEYVWYQNKDHVEEQLVDPLIHNLPCVIATLHLVLNKPVNPEAL